MNPWLLALPVLLALASQALLWWLIRAQVRTSSRHMMDWMRDREIHQGATLIALQEVLTRSQQQAILETQQIVFMSQKSITGSMREEFSQQDKVLLTLRSDVAGFVSREAVMLAVVQRESTEQLRAAIASLEVVAPAHPLTGLAFLPTDEQAADIEMQAKRAEDHAISATGQIRYSSRPSPTSAQPSRRGPSTQRVPPSGPP